VRRHIPSPDGYNTRTDRVALPFLQVPVTSRITPKTIDLEADAHLGLHIRKKRLELKLRQVDVANQIGISEDCVTFWENGRSKPQIQHMPKIIAFLGYNPVTYENVTIGGQIKNYRITNGLSHKKLGKILGVDASTIGSWENSKFIHDQRTLIRLNKLIKTIL